ncbi:hypothetical protein GO495_24785 [Chitinophaga oryziterrae]|uniref:Uncharacterized protein n=1 Tax=Chitinophaga oryziterrae TaxID=1031224 RepID=A0A6N8JFV2_9BACT|nr:hypothetical protein [Chitinophaga oryziterrae]MVT43834.1 hypothetical protein [Chitinophaga oryziterrae]
MNSTSLENIVLELNEYDPEEVQLSIDSADFRVENPYLNITVRIEMDETREEKWRIYLIGYLSGHISTATSFYVDLKKDHPLLWDYNNIQASLYFNGQPDDFYRLYWDLHNIHTSLYGSYNTIDKYLNEVGQLDKLLKSGYGLLANGPKNLLVKFAECLEENGIKSSITNEREPVYWNGSRTVSALQNLSVLLIGESYIITNEFKIEKISATL